MPACSGLQPHLYVHHERGNELECEAFAPHCVITFQVERYDKHRNIWEHVEMPADSERAYRKRVFPAVCSTSAA